ncbi:MAG: thioether cross-link-forming SCIFF peptide maturase [Christensenellales bacterium]|jgi:uncharacterized protein
MVHSFTCLGKNICMDVDSGCIYDMDDLAFQVVSLYKEGRQAVLDGVAGYSPAEIEEAYREVDGLVQQGLLFTEYDYSLVQRPKTVIKAACLHIAHDCNLRCCYCFAATGSFKGQRTLMDAETGKKALDFLVAQSGNRVNLEVDFFGGEPFMNLDAVREIVAYGRELERKIEKRFSFTITTNAMELDDPTRAFLDREMSNVVLSVDGRKPVHDAMRKTREGKGSYDTAVANALQIARERQDKQHYVRGTFTAYNLDFTQDVLSLRDAGFEQISIEPVVTDEKLPFAIREHHLERICEEYETLAQEYIRSRKEGKWFNFFHFMVDTEDGGPCISKRLGGCGAGSEYVAITPEGDIYPCHQFAGEADFKLGNLYEGELDTDRMEHFAASTVLTKEECRDCWAKYYCGGGCAASAYHANGDISRPYGISCALEKKRVECALAIAAIERESAQ